MIHRHKWIVVSQDEQPSSLEIANQTGSDLSMKHGFAHEVIMMTTRPVIVKRSCKICQTEEVKRI